MTDLSFLELIAPELGKVERLLRDHPPGQHDAISRAVDHLVEGGGKTVELTLATITPPGKNQYCAAFWSRPHLVSGPCPR